MKNCPTCGSKCGNCSETIQRLEKESQQLKSEVKNLHDKYSWFLREIESLLEELYDVEDYNDLEKGITREQALLDVLRRQVEHIKFGGD